MALAFNVSETYVLPSFSLAGKKVFISGGSRGIGRACAVTLAAAGADVAVGSSPAGTSPPKTCAARSASWGGGPRRMRSTSRRAARSRRCARASTTTSTPSTSWSTTPASPATVHSGRWIETAWDTVINTNLNSVFDVTQRFIDKMAARGWGRVINISSIVGRVGNFGQANYAAAKAGLIGLTKTLAREYARKGVTVNAIAPGFVRTRMLDGVPDKALQTVLDNTPVGRLGDPMEIAASVLYLASPAAGFVTGHVLDVNGGMAM